MSDLFADIILPLPLADSYTYSVPSQWTDTVRRGCRVIVPLGAKLHYVGIVLEVHRRKPEGINIKPITEVLESQPLVNETQLRFWQWVAHYYICSLGEVYNAALPAKLKTVRSEKLGVRNEGLGVRSYCHSDVPLCDHSSLLTPHSSLNTSQQTAYEEILSSFETKDVILLHGVTSSGKTEVYIHLICKCLAEGKQVLYMLPEIALTTQITERLRRVFGDNMGVYHSKFGDAQRRDLYLRQASSSSPYGLILGVRSSVFLPYSNLGLIIVDEEHETSYKQQDPAPRYHARSAAIVLANMFGAKVLLGTATPSFESYHRARKGQYGYVQLTKRYADMQLPDIRVVDIARLRQQKRIKGVFSSELIDAVREALNRNEQVILFQNRRGFSNFVECRTCGWVPRCAHCDVSLTYHKKSGKLSCHYCGKMYDLPQACPMCSVRSEELGVRGETKFTFVGTGTERIEDSISKIFPEARTLRLDLDTAKTRSAYERIIDDFSAHRADILIGTQMVTKGLDFDNVSVVGVLDADTMLNQPDFRSYERAFHTLSQVAGRAGRKHRKGKVILQTRSAGSDIIAQVVANDYWNMFRTQMEERKMFRYPPFHRLIYVYLRHRDAQVLDQLAANMALFLQSSFGTERILGPASPPVSRVHSLFIRQIIIKMEQGSSVSKVREVIAAARNRLLALPYSNGLSLHFDVDPV